MDKLALQFYLTDFRSHLKETRVNLGISTERMCEALDVTRQSLSNFENNRGVFKLVNALAISTLFDYAMRGHERASEILKAFAIARPGYEDYIQSGGGPPAEIPSLSYAWQKKQAFYAAEQHSPRFTREAELPNLRLFVDVFSYANPLYQERFLWWMLRVCEPCSPGSLNLMIDDTIRDIRSANPDAERLAPLLNALSSARERRCVSIRATPRHAVGFGQAALYALRSQGYDFRQCAMVSASPETLLECLPLRALVINADGTPLELTERQDVLLGMRRAMRQESEQRDQAISKELLDSLFDE